MVWTVFTGFVFVEPGKSMTVNAFDSWRRRNKLRELDLIVHTSADIVAESLLSCLRPQNDKESCKYFLPLSIEGASAGGVIFCWIAAVCFIAFRRQGFDRGIDSRCGQCHYRSSSIVVPT